MSSCSGTAGLLTRCIGARWHAKRRVPCSRTRRKRRSSPQETCARGARCSSFGRAKGRRWKYAASPSPRCASCRQKHRPCSRISRSTSPTIGGKRRGSATTKSETLRSAESLFGAAEFSEHRGESCCVGAEGGKEFLVRPLDEMNQLSREAAARGGWAQRVGARVGRVIGAAHELLLLQRANYLRGRHDVRARVFREHDLRHRFVLLRRSEERRVGKEWTSRLAL